MAESGEERERGGGGEEYDRKGNIRRDEDEEDHSLASGRTRPPLMEPEILQRLLADAITYESSIEDIGVIIRCGGDVNGPVKRGLRPLHYAAYNDYVDAIELLVRHGADVNGTDEIGYTPLHLCARKGNIRSMKALILLGATVDFMTEEDSGGEEKNKDSRALGYLTIEPLNIAIENNHVDCVRLLLDSGARADHKYFMGYEINLCPLENLECMELILQHGADPDAFNRCGTTPLMKACRHDNMAAVRLLLRYGASVNIQSPPRFERKSALHVAIQKGNSGIVHALLRHGAETKNLPEYKHGALHAAVLADRPDILEMLIKFGADVDQRTDEKVTPLMLVCGSPEIKNQLQLAEVLLRHGADPNTHATIFNYTSPSLAPVIEVVRTSGEDNPVSMEMLKLLLRYGAKLNFRGFGSLARLKDPFGVLQHVHRLHDDRVVFEFLVHAACEYDLEGINVSATLSPWERSWLLVNATTPRELKHLTRLALRRILTPVLPDRARELPIPTIMQNYLLFD